MAKFTSLFFCLCLGWISSLETYAGHRQDDSDLLLKVIATLFDDNEITDVRDIHSKKQASSDVKGVHTGNKHTSGSDVKNADRRNTGDTRHVGNDDIQRILDTEDVGKEDQMFLKELEAFLSSKRNLKKWIVDDPNSRATETPGVAPAPTPPPPTNPPTTTTAAPKKMCKIKVNGGWWFRTKPYYIYYFC